MVKYKKSYLKQRRFGAGERFETLEKEEVNSKLNMSGKTALRS